MPTTLHYLRFLDIPTALVKTWIYKKKIQQAFQIWICFYVFITDATLDSGIDVGPTFIIFEFFPSPTALSR